MTVVAVREAPAIICPAWCSSTGSCSGDHTVASGNPLWLRATATGWPSNRNDIVVAPTWGECDGLSPAVALSVFPPGDDLNTELTLDLTPAEAVRLAEHLVRAAGVAMNGCAA